MIAAFFGRDGLRDLLPLRGAGYQSVAVLPFDNLSGDSDRAHVAEGVRKR